MNPPAGFPVAPLEGGDGGELLVAHVRRVALRRDPDAPAFLLDIDIPGESGGHRIPVALTGRYEAEEFQDRRILVAVFRSRGGRILRIEPVYLVRSGGLSLIVLAG